MDCYRCLKGDANLVKLTYPHGDTQQMYLCEEGVTYFEADEAVRTIVCPQLA